MPRKTPAHKAPSPKRPSFPLYCDKDEQARFSKAAELEGFGTRGRNAWILYHLRKIAQETLSKR